MYASGYKVTYGQSAYSVGYSAKHYNLSFEEKPVVMFSKSYFPSSQIGEVHFEPDSFLNPLRSDVGEVNDSSQVIGFVREAFREVMGCELPDSIAIKICFDHEFKEQHASTGGVWSEGIVGFSLNTQGKGVNRIFVRNDQLDRVMLTIGHELGHVLTPSLFDGRDEEAKAYSFSIAWMDVIKEKNIAGIANCILPRPALNGLHDVGFAFTMKLLNEGKNAMDVFRELVYGVSSIGGFYG
jgi:hypothetical protein